MANMMKTLTKAALGTVATGAMLSATPAAAQWNDRYDRDRDGISAGEVAFRILFVHWAAVAIWIWCEMDTSNRCWRCAPHREPGHAHAELCAAMEPLTQGNDLTIARVDLGQQ